MPAPSHTHTYTHTLSLYLDPSVHSVLVFNTLTWLWPREESLIRCNLSPSFPPFRSHAASSSLFAIMNHSHAIGATQAQHSFPSPAPFKQLMQSQRILVNDIQVARTEPMNHVNRSEDNNLCHPSPMLPVCDLILGTMLRTLFLPIPILNSRMDHPSAI